MFVWKSARLKGDINKESQENVFKGFQPFSVLPPLYYGSDLIKTITVTLCGLICRPNIIIGDYNAGFPLFYFYLFTYIISRHIEEMEIFAGEVVETFQHIFLWYNLHKKLEQVWSICMLQHGLVWFWVVWYGWWWIHFFIIFF